MTKRPTLILNNSKKNASVKSNNTVFENKVNTKVKDEAMKPKPDTTQIDKDVKLEANTKSSNSKENVKKIFLTDKEYNQILSYFKEHYPKLFPNSKKLVPLALGIHRQIFTLDVPFSNLKIRRFLHKYTRSWKYQSSLAVGKDRLDINGKATSKVSEEEIAYIKEKIKNRAEYLKKANHDSLIKKAMESPIAARELLSEYLPSEYLEYIDLDTLKIEKESFIEDSLKTKFSDIIYSAQAKENTNSAGKSKEVLVYTLLEHQSSPDYWVALRLWKYSMLLLERHAEGKNKLPVIIPLLLYNGKKKYNAPLNLWDLFSNPELAKKAMSGDYKLIDLESMSDDDIDYEKHLSFLLYVMKHIHDRDILAMLKEAMAKCTKALIIDKGQDYVHTKLIFWYTNSKVPAENKQLLEELIVGNLPKNDKEVIMRTVADTYIDEGINKGIAIGKNEGIAIGKNEGIAIGVEKTAINMIRQNLDNKLISSVTGLSADDVLKLQNKI